MNHNFFKCGVTGLCLEVTFSSLRSLLHHDYRMTGKTSLLMFPIYGAAAALKPLCWLLRGANVLARGTVYMLCIYSGELFSGQFLKKRNLCPWDYNNVPHNYHGLICLGFAPLWFLTVLNGCCCQAGNFQNGEEHVLYLTLCPKYLILIVSNDSAAAVFRLYRQTLEIVFACICEEFEQIRSHRIFGGNFVSYI